MKSPVRSAIKTVQYISVFLVCTFYTLSFTHEFVRGFLIPDKFSSSSLSNFNGAQSAREIYQQRSLLSRNERLDNIIGKRHMIKITPDGSKDMEEYRRNVIDTLVTKTDDTELDGYQLFDLIVAKWGVAYGIEFRKLVFAGKPLLYLNIMWKYLGQDSFPLSEQEYLEHLQFISERLIEWDKVKEVKEFIRDVRKKPNAYFGYAVSIPLNIDEETVAKLFPEESSIFGETK